MSIIIKCLIGPSNDTLDRDCPSSWCQPIQFNQIIKKPRKLFT